MLLYLQSTIRGKVVRAKTTRFYFSTIEKTIRTELTQTENSFIIHKTLFALHLQSTNSILRWNNKDWHFPEAIWKTIDPESKTTSISN